MTKSTRNGHPVKDLAKSTKNNKEQVKTGREARTEINTRKAARETQQLATVPPGEKSHGLVEEKIRQLKELIAKGTYEVNPREVAQRMIFAGIPSCLEEKKVRWIDLDLAELLELRRKRNGAEESCDATWEITSPSRHGQSSRFVGKSVRNRT